jgi:hypothetical protein
MTDSRNAPQQFVLRPTVALCIPYFGVWAVAMLWGLATLKFPTVAETDPPRMLAAGPLVLVTLIHAALLLALLRDGRIALEAQVGLRRAQLCGVVLAAILVGWVQWAAILAYGFHVSAT